MVNSIPSLGSQAAGAADALAVRPATGRPIQSLSGNVQLTGFGWMSTPPPSFTNINFNGSVNVQGPGGLIGNGNFYVNGSVFLSGSNFVTGNVPLSITVQVYKNGQPVGTGTVNGNIFVSGMVNSGSVNLNGSGMVWGNVNVPGRGRGRAPSAQKVLRARAD
jgi:hypothetical protein